MGMIYKPLAIIWVLIAMGIYMKLSSYLSTRIGHGWADFWGILGALTFVVLSIYLTMRLSVWGSKKMEERANGKQP